MDNALSAASDVAGVLSLTIQLVELTQRYTSRMIALPRTVSSYFADLTFLKQLLSDVQNSLALPPTTTGAWAVTPSVLMNELHAVRLELEDIQEKLHRAQSEPLFAARNVFWPFPEDETTKWACRLRSSKGRIESAINISTLRLQLQALSEIQEFRNKTETTEQQRERRLILDWISHESWKQKHAELISSHHLNTGRWIFETPEFQAWVNGGPGTLWCHGDPGTGKTQLMSLVVEYLSRTSKLAYFYCNYHSSGNKNVTTEIAAAVLRQLVDSQKKIPSEVEYVYQTLGNGCRKLQLDDITGLIRRISSSDPGFFIVVDGIDECGSHRKPVLQLLRTISKSSTNVLISGRSHVTEIYSLFSPIYRLEIKAPISDLKSFAEERIEASELSELIPDGAKQEIVRQIADQSSGIFLIAALKCIHLTHLTRFSEIKSAVRAYSSGLDDLYKESMERITLQPSARRATAIKALSWIYHAKRQLTVGELVHALAIEYNEAIPTYEDVISEKTLLDVCAGLVVIDSKETTARFVHHTLREYFDTAYETWFCGERRRITKACLTYIRLLSPDRSLADSITCYPFLAYAGGYWGAHARDEYHEELDDIALAVLNDITALEKISGLMDSAPTERNTMPMFPCENLAVQIAARFGALQVLEVLLEHHHSPGDADSYGRTALHWAARGGFADVVRILLRKGAEPSPKTKNGMTPFHWAAKHGHDVVIDELMPRINPAEATPDGRTALHWASSQGRISIVKKLLSGEKIDLECQSLNGWTPLHWAACSGNRAVVTYGVNSTQGTGGLLAVPREAFSMSGGESSGHEEVMELLLESGADPNLGNKENQTPLHWAAVSGNAKIVSLLLSKGAERDIRDVHGLTPRQFALENRADETVISLLSPSRDRS